MDGAKLVRFVAAYPTAEAFSGVDRVHQRKQIKEIRKTRLQIVVIGGKSWYNRGIGRLGRVGKRLIRQRRLDMGRVDNTGG